MNNQIFLIGPPGVGKTTMGSILAKKLNYQFVDMDQYIEQKYNTKIFTLIEANGEDKFRNLENEALLEIIKLKNVVIASGGGIVNNKNNINLMQNYGIVIYLKADSNNLLYRLKNSYARPLIQACIKQINNMLSKREKLYYKSSNIIINTNNLGIRQTYEQIIKKLNVIDKLNNNNLSFNSSIVGAINAVNLNCKHNKVAIITDRNVYSNYYELFNKNLNNNIIFWVVLNNGEENKDFNAINKIISKLIELKFDRSSALIALGGGVVGDITGFAASMFMRGISWYNIPTTLLSQADSTLGGKTGVNFNNVKNIIGAFWQPKFSFSSPEFLKTLSNREYNAGMAEVIKYGIAFDEKFLAYIEKNKEKIKIKEPDVLEYLIIKSCDYKFEIVSKDKYENNIRALLNLGHTFGHAIESVYDFNKYLHGEAVSIGMIFAAKFSLKLGYISENDLFRIKNLLAFFDLPVVDENLDFNSLLKFMMQDKKCSNKLIKLILIKKIGAAKMHEVDLQELKTILFSLPTTELEKSEL